MVLITTTFFTCIIGFIDKEIDLKKLVNLAVI
jgi:hypothetical protein